MRRPKLLVALFSLSLLVTLIAVGCAGTSSTHGLSLAPLAGMPADVQSAPGSVQEAYRFAAANSEVLMQIPCYCGCGAMGHTSNYACYISGENSDGNLSFDSHALGCSICVDITQDTMRLLKQGKSVAEIRTYVDQTYAQYGPSNMLGVNGTPGVNNTP
jgi:hypothetical protein